MIETNYKPYLLVYSYIYLIMRNEFDMLDIDR